MSWFVDRMNERSTWAGLLAVVSALLGQAFPEAIAASITDCGVYLGGGLAMIMREREA